MCAGGPARRGGPSGRMGRKAGCSLAQLLNGFWKGRHFPFQSHLGPIFVRFGPQAASCAAAHTVALARPRRTHPVAISTMKALETALTAGMAGSKWARPAKSEAGSGAPGACMSHRQPTTSCTWAWCCASRCQPGIQRAARPSATPPPVSQLTPAPGPRPGPQVRRPAVHGVRRPHPAEVLALPGVCV